MTLSRTRTSLVGLLLLSGALVGCRASTAGSPAPVAGASVAPASPAAPAETLPARLARVWTAEKRAPVADPELADAVDALMAFHVGNGFFEDRLVGMRRIERVGPQGDLEIAISPKRHVPGAKSDPGDRCVMCNPPQPLERGLLWREYYVWPNAFPYVPAERQHVLIVPVKHQPQGFYLELLADLIDYQRLAAGGRPLTLHYNGYAGNSQYHLHWHATREVTPLERALDAGRLGTESLLSDSDGRIVAYEGSAYVGMLVEGSRDFLLRWAPRLVRQLDRDPLTQRAFNLVMLQPREGAIRLAVIPRRAANLKPVIGSLGARGLGAFNVAGIFVLPQPEVPADLADALPNALRASCVPAREFAWTRSLASLADEPGPAAPRRPTDGRPAPSP